jgi:DNA polymerase I-like protein with 3'-5' exonuclease and polymerase domains
MGEADGAQLEFRIATHLGRDPQGWYDITTGVDVHKYTASVILDIPEEEVTREQRQEAKADTFKPTYGGKSGTPAQQKYYEAFSKKYSALYATQTKWTHQVVENKKLETEYGMVYHWPDCKMTQYGYITHTTNIFNYPVQGFATAEIIPIALVCAWHRMADMESFLVNTVHDSIIAELHPDEVDQWHEVAKQCLIVDCYDILESLYKVELTVPLGAGVMVGTHWANKEAKDNETVYEADPDLYLEAAHAGGMT